MTTSGTLFWVVMVKRADGKVYADLHKVPGLVFFLSFEEAWYAWMTMHPDIRNSYHVVQLEARCTND